VPEADPVVQLQGVCKSFGQVRALQTTDLELRAGETTVLIGQSGCGKSTVLRLIIRLLVPDAGRVLFEGSPLTDDNVRLVRHRVGYVIQEGGLFPHLTARANVTLLARHLKTPLVDIDARIEELAELTRLPSDCLERHPGMLSGGQRQRVALMRALFLDPDLLLLDEPLGALDPIIRAELQTDLKHIFARLGKTVCLVTHDLAEAAHFADRIVLMRDGSIVQEGSFDDLLNRPAVEFVTTFVNAQRGLIVESGTEQS
jgi:osmoprotectant transport system ATP-binding protein